MSLPLPHAHPGLTIGDLAKAAGVNVETIRFYQRKELMPEPERPQGSIRRYDQNDLSRLHFAHSTDGGQ